jgi:hypothetical protein
MIKYNQNKNGMICFALLVDTVIHLLFMPFDINPEYKMARKEDSDKIGHIAAKYCLQGGRLIFLFPGAASQSSRRLAENDESRPEKNA